MEVTIKENYLVTKEHIQRQPPLCYIKHIQLQYAKTYTSFFSETL